MIFQSGDSPTIPLLEAGIAPDTLERWKVVDKMNMITQYAFAGDYTGENSDINFKLPDTWLQVEAIEKAVTEVAKFDADDWFVIAISDANFDRYQITAADLKRSLFHDPKVRPA